MKGPKTEHERGNMSTSCNEFDARVCNFEGEYYLSEDKRHWIRLGIVQTTPPTKYQGAQIPLVVELIEVDLARDHKRADTYHFAWFHTGCSYHGHCETQPDRPADTSGTGDRDISRLLQYQDQIAELLTVSELPAPLKDNLVIQALASKTLEK